MEKNGRGRREQYRMRTRLIHWDADTKRWDFDHHLIPPISASTTYRLGSVHRGAQGFVEFASEDADVKGHVPVYVYDRLDEPTRGMLEENLAVAEGGETAVTFATGMAAVSAAVGVALKAGDEIVAHQTLYGCTYSLFTEWLPRYGITTRFADLRFIDYVADHAYSVTLAVSLGQLRTPIEEPYTMTHSAPPEEVKRRRGMEPGGIRLSVGLEDWHDIIEDLQAAFERI